MHDVLVPRLLRRPAEHGTHRLLPGVRDHRQTGLRSHPGQVGPDPRTQPVRAGESRLRYGLQDRGRGRQCHRSLQRRSRHPRCHAGHHPRSHLPGHPPPCHWRRHHPADARGFARARVRQEPAQPDHQVRHSGRHQLSRPERHEPHRLLDRQQPCQSGRRQGSGSLPPDVSGPACRVQRRRQGHQVLPLWRLRCRSGLPQPHPDHHHDPRSFRHPGALRRLGDEGPREDAFFHLHGPQDRDPSGGAHRLRHGGPRGARPAHPLRRDQRGVFHHHLGTLCGDLRLLRITAVHLDAHHQHAAGHRPCRCAAEGAGRRCVAEDHL